MSTFFFFIWVYKTCISRTKVNQDAGAVNNQISAAETITVIKFPLLAEEEEKDDLVI